MQTLLEQSASKRRFRCPCCGNIVYTDSAQCRFCGAATDPAEVARLADALAEEQARERARIERETESAGQEKTHLIGTIVRGFFRFIR